MLFRTCASLLALNSPLTSLWSLLQQCVSHHQLIMAIDVRFYLGKDSIDFGLALADHAHGSSLWTLNKT